MDTRACELCRRVPKLSLPSLIMGGGRVISATRRHGCGVRIITCPMHYSRQLKGLPRRLPGHLTSSRRPSTIQMLRVGVRVAAILSALALMQLLVALHCTTGDLRYGGGSSVESSPEQSSSRLEAGTPLMAGGSKTPNKKRQRSSWYSFDPPPSNVVSSVDGFVFFVGYARSGHSIIASLLNAHPNIVIAHEYALFNHWFQHPELYNDRKEALFNMLYNSSRYSAERQGTQGIRKKGYTLEVPGWYQGTYEGGMTIIGDKAGGMTAQVYRQSQENFISIDQQLCSTTMIPVHAIHVVRNPFDNIATMLLYNEHVKRTSNETHKYRNFEALSKRIRAYFVQVGSVLSMIEQAGLNDITVHHSNFVANPKGTMRRLCNSLSVTCSERYLHMVAEQTFCGE